MRLKTILISIGFVLVSYLSFSQDAKPSLLETANWIKSKFEAYITGCEGAVSDCNILQYPPYYKFNVNAYIEGCHLHFIFSNKSNLAHFGNEDVYIDIPIYDIKEINHYGIKTVNSTIKFEYPNYTQFEDGNCIDRKYYRNFFRFSMDWDREENLLVRMQKAFENLKSYCPKPKSTEVY